MVEVYIDDMVVKSIYEEDHHKDLWIVFDTLRLHCLKLNASSWIREIPWIQGHSTEN